MDRGSNYFMMKASIVPCSGQRLDDTPLSKKKHAILGLFMQTNKNVKRGMS